jgi:hypothetical protein
MHTAAVMRFSFFFAGCFAIVTGLVACSSSSGGGADTTAAQNAFADAFCAQFKPCCAGSGLRIDGVACHDWITQQARGAVFDHAAGDACLAAMQADAPGAAFCTTLGPTAGTACAQVFEPPSGTVPPGGACKSYEDCQAPANGFAYCYLPIDTTGKQTFPEKCMQTIWGKPGDGPCVSQLQGAVTETSGPGLDPLPEVTYACDESTGVFCDFGGTHQCTPFRGAGQPCTQSGDECGPDGWCQMNADVSPPTWKCVAALPVGASCDTFQSQCGSQGRCSKRTSTCVAIQPEGSACTLDEQCPYQCFQRRCISYAESDLCGI